MQHNVLTSNTESDMDIYTLLYINVQMNKCAKLKTPAKCRTNKSHLSSFTSHLLQYQVVKMLSSPNFSFQIFLTKMTKIEKMPNSCLKWLQLLDLAHKTGFHATR